MTEFNHEQLEKYMNDIHMKWTENFLDDDVFAMKLSKVHDFLDRNEQDFTVRRLVKIQSNFTGELIEKRGRIF